MLPAFSPRVAHHGAAVVEQEPLPLPVGTLAGAAQDGLPSGSGAVQEANQLQPYGGPGLVPGAPFTLETDAPIITQNPPDSLLQDRPLHGGVRTLTAFGEYLPPPPNAGGFQVLAGRPPQAPILGDQMQAAAIVTDATWREAPPVLDLCRRVPVTLPVLDSPEVSA